MLKKKYRLRGTIDPRASVLHTQFFTLRFFSNNLSESRFGFIVSKKVDKRAVVRNKVKRKIRSCIEEMMDKIRVGYDMLFLIKKSAIEKERICIFVKDVLDREGLMR